MTSWDRTTRQALPSSEVTHFHLLRHGRVECGGERRAYGHTDYPLSEQGKEQAEALIRHVIDRIPKPDGVLSSDLQRCGKIAERLADEWSVPLLSLPALREQYMGEWEGVSWSSLTGQDVAGVRDFWQNYDTAHPPGGESLGDLSHRIQTLMQEKAEMLRGRRWAIVTHIGVIRSLLCDLMGIPIGEALRFAPLPGTHTWVIKAEAGAVLQVMGERPMEMDGGPAEAARVEVDIQGHGRPPRLAFSGSAGTGKTTLAREVAGICDVPYIPEGMRARLENGLRLHGMSQENLAQLMWDLWREQREREEEAVRTHGGFVSDRSAVDFAAFWLTYRLHHGTQQTEAFFAETLGSLVKYDRVVVLPWGLLPLVADGVRASNTWVQRHYQATLEGLHQREVSDARLAWMPRLVGLNERVAWILDLLREPGSRGNR